ncbi:MAG: hypothetical protein PHS14_11010 [Elusimicrobia bacterium]|nr:hypothetical protein [Elusimicrobiota bacterium]
MKTALLIAALAAAACKAPKPPVPGEPPVPAVAAEPAAESPMEPNKAEKYVSGLQADVKRAGEAKAKADAAAKKTEESGKIPE